MSTMNSDTPFSTQEKFDNLMKLLDEDPDLTSGPYTAPETSLPHGSVGHNEFGQDVYSALSDDQYWQNPPPETLANNSSYYDQEQTYTSGSVQPGQFVPGIYSPGGYEQVRLQYQHRTEPTVALDAPSSLDNEAFYSPAAANPIYNTGIPVSERSLTPQPIRMSESPKSPFLNQPPAPAHTSSMNNPPFAPSLGYSPSPGNTQASMYSPPPVQPSFVGRSSPASDVPSMHHAPGPAYTQPMNTTSTMSNTLMPSHTPARHYSSSIRRENYQSPAPVQVSAPGSTPFMDDYPLSARFPSSTFHGPVTPREEVVRPTSRPQYAPWSPQAPGPQRTPDWQYGELRHPPGPQRLPGPQHPSGPQHVPESRSRSAPSRTSATHRPPVINHHPPVTHHTVATGDVPAPPQSENKDAGTGEQAADGADGAGAVKSTTPKHILDKEKQARAAIRKLKAKTSMDGQMGESITMVRTNTGVEFSGTMWKAPANDVTIPTTEKDIKACVDALDVAMHNVVNIREKADITSSTNRWNSKSKYYFPEEYNAAAGLLVKELIKIHTDGWTKQIFDSNEREQCQLTQFYTFEDRFEGLRELLHYSKTSCQDIMKGSRFYTIIANPRNLIHRTATNKTANVNKGNQIKAGKKVMKKESSAKASSNAAASSSGEDKGHGTKEQDSEEGSNSEESTKVKKASRGKKRAREETFVAEDPAGQPPRKKAPAKKRGGA